VTIESPDLDFMYSDSDQYDAEIAGLFVVCSSCLSVYLVSYLKVLLYFWGSFLISVLFKDMYCTCAFCSFNSNSTVTSPSCKCEKCTVWGQFYIWFASHLCFELQQFVVDFLGPNLVQFEPLSSENKWPKISNFVKGLDVTKGQK